MTAIPPELLEKERALEEGLRGAGQVLVAFSGGVDSSYLALAAHRAVGKGALAVTAVSPSYPESHRAVAEEVVERFGIAHRFVDTREMESDDYRANRPDRCYHCKSELFDVLGGVRDELGFDAVAYGVNTDDTGDFRPGHRAADERGVLSPFLDAGLSKAEIRALSRAAGLPTADLPASACLASRLPYGTEVTEERLSQVEKGEERLRALGRVLTDGNRVASSVSVLRCLGSAADNGKATRSDETGRSGDASSAQAIAAARSWAAQEDAPCTHASSASAI